MRVGQWIGVVIAVIALGMNGRDAHGQTTSVGKMSIRHPAAGFHMERRARGCIHTGHSQRALSVAVLT